MADLTVDALVSNLDQVLAFVDGQLETMDCSMKAQMQIDVAVEEIYVNIANYAYAPETGKAYISVRPDPEPVTEGRSGCGSESSGPFHRRIGHLYGEEKYGRNGIQPQRRAEYPDDHQKALTLSLPDLKQRHITMRGRISHG